MQALLELQKELKTNSESKPYEQCETCIIKHRCRKKDKVKKMEKGDICTFNIYLKQNSKNSKIPSKYMYEDLTNFKLIPENVELFSTMMEINIQKEVDKGTNFILINDVTGSGKTHAGCVLLNEYMFKYSTQLISIKDPDTGLDTYTPICKFVSIPDFIETLKRSFNDDFLREQIEAEIFQIKNAPLVMFDDVGAEKDSEWVRHVIYTLINYRSNNSVASIYTSNNTLKELEDENRLGARVISRIHENPLYLDTGNIDRRKYPLW